MSYRFWEAKSRLENVAEDREGLFRPPSSQFTQDWWGEKETPDYWRRSHPRYLVRDSVTIDSDFSVLSKPIYATAFCMVMTSKTQLTVHGSFCHSNKWLMTLSWYLLISATLGAMAALAYYKGANLAHWTLFGGTYFAARFLPRKYP